MYSTYYLSHHGIEGQRWGVRNGPPYPLTSEARAKTANSSKKSKADFFKEDEIFIKGEKVKLQKRGEPITAKFLSTFVPSIAENMSGWRDYTIKKLDGKKIGNLTLDIQATNSLNIVWINIKNSEMNKGFGQSVMRTVIETAKMEKFEEITLEVPDDDPNARHIYEKYGFVDNGKIGDLPEEDGDLWIGLNKMILKIKGGDKNA